nr:MAG TPA: hypothetical protein [Caudoviricetes sp.]
MPRTIFEICNFGDARNLLKIGYLLLYNKDNQ